MNQNNSQWTKNKLCVLSLLENVTGWLSLQKYLCFSQPIALKWRGVNCWRAILAWLLRKILFVAGHGWIRKSISSEKWQENGLFSNLLAAFFLGLLLYYSFLSSSKCTSPVLFAAVMSRQKNLWQKQATSFSIRVASLAFFSAVNARTTFFFLCYLLDLSFIPL